MQEQNLCIRECCKLNIQNSTDAEALEILTQYLLLGKIFCKNQQTIIAACSLGIYFYATSHFRWRIYTQIWQLETMPICGVSISKRCVYLNLTEMLFTWTKIKLQMIALRDLINRSRKVCSCIKP
ncbi:hypothetical protein NERG_01595 [Nematocida ausubeli]|uniref:Uncharacterized protein n=1 Tax=Nematocida ausubeli (strain ATCC PRA-371 / ERTm2) TaxID=1913371 RepID=H8ZDC4_NEMA1|nr:hypothetical protein NERG_01595 [Nematocida ausubeli]